MRLRVLCAAVALSAMALTAARASLIRPATPGETPEVTWRLPVATAPIMPRAPEVDGVVSRAEWGSAAQLAGLIALDRGLATDDPQQVWVGYTADALYIGFRFTRPPHAPEPSAGDDPMGVWRDDAIEVFLQPDPAARGEFNFVGNCKGVHEEGYRTSATDKGWTAQWSYAARPTDTGWEGEMSIPFASLSTGTPAPGDAWAFTVANNQHTPRPDPASWSFLKEWKASGDLGYLRFGGQSPAIRLLGAGEVSRSEVGAQIEASNFGERDARIVVRTALLRPAGQDPGWFASFDSAAEPLGRPGEAEAATGADKALPSALAAYEKIAEDEQTLTVPANQTRRVSFSRPSARGAYVLHYEVRDAGTGEILAAGPLPFMRRAPLEVVLTPYLLCSGVVEVTADYRRVPGVAEGDRVLVQLSDAAGQRVREENMPADVAGRQTVLDLDVKDAQPGDYRVSVALVAGDGTERGRRQEDLRIPPRPEWWDNPVGHPEATDTVPWPWTAMERSDDGLRVWNREITLGDRLQPAQITNGGVAMLASPATLDLGLDG
ncbi:MAG TPA: sugar-binding protein, partial [Armatimonadota bacterium]|nr:sugar-binding protein [Armatimonadota bacterium]